ncbi:neurogenic locus notch homolog protein 1 [Octopus bimaculoides]|nr:neurogenic locus notch homolog protein 1 [Octopus bimaculoides]
MKTLCFLTLIVIAVVLTRTSGTKQSFPVFNLCVWNPCKNGGQCFRRGRVFACKCRPGYTGRQCQIVINPCLRSPCKNGGVCRRRGHLFSCKCRPGYIGRYCNVLINPCLRSPCKNGGVCRRRGYRFSCKCRPGYIGRYCNVLMNPCLRRPCKNGGVCRRRGHRFSCKCRPGYIGRYCNVLLNPCHRRPCKNGGVCMRSRNGFHCKCPPGYTGQNCQTFCRRAVADIVFVLDESGSITHRNFEVMKSFVKNLIYIFPISRTQVRVGVITFSTYIRNEFNLNKYFTHRQLYYAINRIRYNSGATNTHLALNYLKRHAFQSRAGGRRLIPKIAIVITDGRSTNPKMTRHTAQILKKSGIQVYAIGIGNQVPRSELVTIASHPSKEYVYDLHTFRDLSNIKSGLASKTCLASEPCRGNPCRNGAKCVNLWKNFKCICKSGFRGKRCEIVVNPCHKRPCKNGGACIRKGHRFTCKCRPGYTGTYCHTFNPCHKRPCKNGGTCIGRGRSFSCKCRPGYSGRYCHAFNPCHRRPCKNGGACIGRGRSFSCKCRPGYSGRYCHAFNPCHRRPCKNGGACIGRGRSFSCKCRPGYSGRYCHAFNPCHRRPCKNGGVCFRRGRSFACRCRPGYSGRYCLAFNPCHRRPCGNGGVCIGRGRSFSCKCRPGYSGRYCRAFNPCHKRPCKNGGVCMRRGRGFACKCRPGYTGLYCQSFNPCHRRPCKNGGACIRKGHRFTCKCRPGYTGRYCNRLLNPCRTRPCKNGGTCIRKGRRFTCKCKPGYSGRYCNRFNPCHSRPCKNGGVCIAKGYRFVCKCRPGYSGRDCRIFNPCHSRPCKNGGVCVRRGQSFTCKCPPGYAGQYCRTPCQTAVADIVFVLDESGSITRPNFKTMKTFVNNLISVFPISRKQVRVGVVTFSTQIKNEFNLNRYFTHRQLYHAIDRIQYNSGMTNTHLALDYLKKHAFQSEDGSRKHIPQIAIVITDGRSSRPKQTQRTAQILKDSGIHIYAIGIGSQVPRSELVTIASHPSKEYIYGINSFSDLSKIQAGLASKTCIVDPCSSSPCKNNGTCINKGYEFRCQCQSGFRGDVCSIVDPCSSFPCKNNGICKNNGYEFSCQCRDGFRGDVCNIKPPCSSSPCQNGGTCTNKNDDFSCQCQPVYRGKDCSIVDPCHIRPCKNNGSCTNNGTSYTCECTPYFIGKSCEKAKPECSCMTFGKMFYRTFDDQMLQFNGSCSETLVKSVPGTNYTDFIVKIIKTKEYSISEPTVTRIVETKFKNTTVRLLPFSTILVNSEERSLPLITKDFTVRLSVGWISLTTDWGLTVKYDGVHQAHVTLPISFAEKVEGNCGNCNGKKDDLLSTPTGMIKVSRKGLQVQPKTSCKSQALTVECSQPMQCDTIFKKPVFQKCVQTIGEENVARLQKSCRASLCSAKNKDEADKLCEILEAFSSECEKASIVVKWRSTTFCPKLCPNNQEYKGKVLKCQPSCINKTLSCTRYTEGCVCKPGFLLSGEECVSESECGCFKNGIYMKLHEEHSLQRSNGLKVVRKLKCALALTHRLGL